MTLILPCANLLFNNPPSLLVIHQCIATMQFLNSILVVASLAVAAVVATPIEARAPPSPCYSNQVLTWNTGQIPGDGGWIVRSYFSADAATILITVISVLQHSRGRVHGILLEDGPSLLQRKHKLCLFTLSRVC